MSEPGTGIAPGGGRPMAVRQLVAMVILGGSGVLAAHLFDIGDLATSPPFFTVACVLLAVGLFSSTSAISLAEARGNLAIIGTAVTVGVLAKAALITVVMVAVFANPAFLVLGVVMAQIDPLSVRALNDSSSLTPRGRAILHAWSSFDDPVTTVLVVVLGGVVVGLTPGANATAGTEVLTYPLAGLVGNAVLVAVAIGSWEVLRRVRRGLQQDHHVLLWKAVAVAVLVGIGIFAVSWFLMLGLAVIGLFFRPQITALLDRLAVVALAVATLMIGLVIADGVALLEGAVLGATAYGAQIVAGLVIARRLPADRVPLALSQQSGITAVILSLLLEPVLPGTVAVVGPAIVVVNVVHLAANRLLGSRTARVTHNVLQPADAGGPRSVG